MGSIILDESKTFYDYLPDPGRVVNAATYNASGTQSIRWSNGLFGASAGWNHMITKNWLLGLEALYEENNISATSTGSARDSNGLVSTSQTVSYNWLFNLGPRLGYRPLNSLLIYLEGGVAVSSLQYQSVSNSLTLTTSNINQTKAGWTAGAGAEWRIENTPYSVDFSYLYARFQNITTSANPDALPYNSSLSQGTDLTSNMVLFTIKYNFST